MKHSVLFSTFLAIFLLFISCDKVYHFSLETPKKTILGKEISISLQEKNNYPIDSVQFFINSKLISNNNNTLLVNTTSLGVGKHLVSALVFYPGKTKKMNNSFEVLAPKAPKIYTYKIINSYPHDTKAYTQGLEYLKGFLYESTGRNGESSIRKVAIKTGKVLQKAMIDSKYFGEGITIFNDKLYSLTWKAKKGFIYDVKTLKKEGEFAYKQSKEGWGFTHNDTELIKSDGTHKIWFLDPETQKEKRFIQAYHHKGKVDKLNELELIEGKIYANYWQKPTIAIIDSKTGIVEGLVNLKGLKKEMEKTQKLVDQDMVLNGIAYDAEHNRLFVTGKYWAKLFEIELVEK